MKAIRIHEFGNSDKLLLENIEIPSLGPDEVLVKIHDVGVNPIDYKIREGIRREMDLPLVMGQDFAGDIVAVGKDVRHYNIGERVFGFAKGSYAEYSLASYLEIAPIPKEMSYETAAAIPTAGVTAWQAIVEEGRVRPGMKVLVHGAAGGVGSFAVQLCNVFGATVIANASSVHERYLKKLAVDQVIDYQTQDFTEVVKDMDVVLDLVGGETYRKSFSVLKPHGVLITTMHETEVLRKDVKVASIVMRKANTDALVQLADLVKRRHVNVYLEETLSLEDARRAQDLLEFSHKNGKFVLHVV